MSDQKTYLGDGVYAKPWRDGVALLTNHGSGPTTCIFLEYAVIRSLGLYLKRIGITGESEREQSKEQHGE